MAGATSITSLGTESVSRAHNVAVMSQGQCTPMPLPSLGTQSILQGNGTNVGTVISLQCPDHHSLMGDKVECVKGPNAAQWEGETYCRPLSGFGEFGFRVAVLASVVSSAVILLLTMAFITCSLHKHFNRKKKRRKQTRNTEEEEWLREQHVGGRAGHHPSPHHHHHHHPHPHHHYSRNNNNNNNNSSSHQKAAPLRQGDHDGAFFDHEAPCGSRLHPYGHHPLPASVPLLPGTGYTRHPASATTATRDIPGPEQDPAGPPHRSSLYLQRNTAPAPGGPLGGPPAAHPPHRSLPTQHTSQESCNSSKECSIRIISV